MDDYSIKKKMLASKKGTYTRQEVKEVLITKGFILDIKKNKIENFPKVGYAHLCKAY